MERYARASKHTLVVCTCPHKVYTPSTNLAAVHDLFSFSSLPSPSTTPFSLLYTPRLSPMAALVGLPIELLENVLVDLEIDDISSLSRTCKDAHRYLSPRVYHSINWCWKDDHQCPPYHLLLRTLLSNPSLASHVKAINLQGGGIIKKSAWDEEGFSNCCDDWVPVIKARSIWADGQRRRVSFNTGDWQRIKAVVSRIATHQGAVNQWLHELYRGNVDATVALLVRQCQKIERLHLGFALVHHSVFLQKVFRQLIDVCKTRVVFPHLASAVLGLDGPATPWNTIVDLDLIRLFFFLPNLARLETIFTEPVVFGWPSPTLTPQTQSLSSMILRKCTTSEKILEKILRCTPNLKNLVYDFRRMVATGSPHWETCKENEEQGEVLQARNYTERCQITTPKIIFQCHYLSKALAHVKSTLESLEVMIRFEHDVWTEVWDPLNSQYLCCLVGRVKGLDQMPKLKSLKMPWVFLVGWRAVVTHCIDFESMDDPLFFGSIDPCPWPTLLPPSLERIQFRDDMISFRNYGEARIDPEDLLNQLLLVRIPQFSALVRVDFVFTWTNAYGSDRWPLQQMERLVSLCERNGLKSEVFRQDCIGRDASVETLFQL
jgi:hypothetical protein